ncbi:MAG TPA: hypothetical protein VHP83_23645, partial [Aggregatilineaceae bacterium]|nr:hypothetical protein [Aggregatilineaceae bacterium]
NLFRKSGWLSAPAFPLANSVGEKTESLSYAGRAKSVVIVAIEDRARRIGQRADTALGISEVIARRATARLRDEMPIAQHVIGLDDTNTVCLDNNITIRRKLIPTVLSERVIQVLADAPPFRCGDRLSKELLW